jgi:hypothetical protein
MFSSSSVQGIRRSGRFYSDFRQDMTIILCVSKEGWKINDFKMKFFLKWFLAATSS